MTPEFTPVPPVGRGAGVPEPMGQNVITAFKSSHATALNLIIGAVKKIQT